MTKTILVTLVLFHVVEFKTIQVFDKINEKYCSQWLDGGWKSSEKGRAPFGGLRVILYLRARTDSAQPIRVV
jgi:hypothetical protein